MTGNELKLAKGLPLDNKGLIENSFPITLYSIGYRYVFRFELQRPGLAVNYFNTPQVYTPSIKIYWELNEQLYMAHT